MKKLFSATLVIIISLIFLISCKKSNSENENSNNNESTAGQTSSVEGQSEGDGDKNFERDPSKSDLYFYPHEFKERGLKFFLEEQYTYEKNTSENILEAASFEDNHLSIGIIYLKNVEAAKEEFATTATVLKERFELNNDKINTIIDTEDSFAFEVSEELYIFMKQIDDSVVLAANADSEGRESLMEILKDLGYI